MLIDLEFDSKFAAGRINPQFKLVSFDTKDGGLIVKYDIPTELNFGDFDGTFHVAERVEKGIYYGLFFESDVDFYTKWKITWSDWEWTRDASSYGLADNLKQILEHGKYFVDHPEPHFLSLMEVNNGDSFNLDKNGQYIGKEENIYGKWFDKKVTKLIHFHFHKLKLKDGEN